MDQKLNLKDLYANICIVMHPVPPPFTQVRILMDPYPTPLSVNLITECQRK